MSGTSSPSPKKANKDQKANICLHIVSLPTPGTVRADISKQAKHSVTLHVFLFWHPAIQLVWSCHFAWATTPQRPITSSRRHLACYKCCNKKENSCFGTLPSRPSGAARLARRHGLRNAFLSFLYLFLISGKCPNQAVRLSVISDLSLSFFSRLLMLAGELVMRGQSHNEVQTDASKLGDTTYWLGSLREHTHSLLVLGSAKPHIAFSRRVNQNGRRFSCLCSALPT